MASSWYHVVGFSLGRRKPGTSPRPRIVGTRGQRSNSMVSVFRSTPPPPPPPPRAYTCCCFLHCQGYERVEIFGDRSLDAMQGSGGFGPGHAGLFSEHADARTVLGAGEDSRCGDVGVTGCFEIKRSVYRGTACTVVRAHRRTCSNREMFL